MIHAPKRAIWAAAVVTGLLAAPGTAFAADGPPPAPAPAGFSGTAGQLPGTGCRGVTRVTLPASGDLTDTGGTEGGHTWTAPAPGGTCVGTVGMFVSYPVAGARTWRVIAITAADAGGQTIAVRTAAEPAPGIYTGTFVIRAPVAGLTGLCLSVTDPSGLDRSSMTCTATGPAAPAQEFTQPAAGPLLP